MIQITVSEAAGFTYAVIGSFLIIVGALVAGVTLTRASEAEEAFRERSAAGERDGGRRRRPAEERLRATA